jgi:protocatechuate 3,4-dioxygenase beta subunit
MSMRNDDAPVGRLVSRRELVALFGASAVTALAHRLSAQASVPGVAAQGGASCVVSPQQTEGPYFVDERLLRSDVRSDPATGAVKPGAPLELELAVAQVTAAGGCAPLAGAIVDIWQCDAMGAYSDARDNGFNTVGQKFLRGYQVTNASGLVRFTTIYPGWYPGRAVHIHFKIRTAAGAAQAYEFTSQFYFDEAMTDRVHARGPYAAHTGRRTSNVADGIFREGGSQLILPVRESSQGYAASFNVAMRPGDPAPVGPGAGRGRGRGRG